MTNILSLKRRPSVARLECSACGAATDAACNCGVPYVPAGTRAAEAIAATPGKSNRAIADEIGVSEPTIRRARKSGASHDAPEKHTGKDGKSYPAYPAKRKSTNTPTGEEIDMLLHAMPLRDIVEIARADTPAEVITEFGEACERLRGGAQPVGDMDARSNRNEAELRAAVDAYADGMTKAARVRVAEYLLSKNRILESAS